MVRLQIQIGSVSAVCPLCGADRFVARHKRPRGMDVLACDGCGSKFTYVFLLDQIARKSIKASDDAISSSKKRRGDPGKD
jgi:transposase-like protein